jgi:SspJ family small acid-soluble spore protein
MSSRPPPLGSIEPDMDIPSEISDAGSKAGAQAVIKHLVGVDFPPDLNKKTERDAFSKSVAGNIFRTFSEVRGSMSKFATDADLAKMLDQRIGEELRKSQGRVKTMDQAEQSAIALNVILDQVGVDVLEQRTTELLLPYGNSLHNAERGTLSHDVEFAGTPLATRLFGTQTKRRVTINPAHPFWRKDKPADLTALRDQIFGKPLAQAGITIDGAPSTEVIDIVIADLITGINTAPVEWETIDHTRTYGALNGMTNGTSWSLNMDILLREKAVFAPGLDTKTLGAATQAEIAYALEHQPGLWKRVVPALESQGPTGIAIPAVPPAPARHWNEVVAQEIFAKLGKAPTAKAATTLVQLHKVKEEVLTKGEAFDKLRDGAYNRTGAVIAMAMLAERSDLLNPPDVKKHEDELKKLKNHTDTHEKVGNVKALTGPKLTLSYDTLLIEQADLLTDKGILDVGPGENEVTYQAPQAAIPAHPGAPAVGGNPAIPPFPGAPAVPERLAVAATVWHSRKAKAYKAKGRLTDDQRTQVLARIAEVDAEIDYCHKIEDELTKLKTHVDSLAAAGIPATSATLNALFPGGTLDKTQIKPGIKFDALSAKIQAELIATGLFSEKDTGEKSKKEQDAIDALKKGSDLKGDALQQMVFTRYCEQNGLPPETANYIAARSFLDDEVNRSINTMLDERFDEEDNWEYSLHNSFYYKVINQVAKASGVSIQETKPKSQQGYFRGSDYYKEPDWAGASYESLVSSYHSLRRMHDAQEGPDFDLSGSNEVKRQMKTIARIIATKFGMDYYTATYGNLKDEEVKKLKAKPQRVTTGVIEKLLNGDPPAGYEARIAHVLKTTKGKVNKKRRKAKEWGKKIGWGVGTALEWPLGKLIYRDSGFSARSLLIGDQTVSAKTAIKFGWKKKLAVATLGTLAVASGGVLAPALFAATYAASGGDEPPAAK